MDRYDFDIVVIGAGIHGAGVAQAGAAAGYRVLVLEQAKVATGTSSRSSKLIHGGLRYLEQFQFALVRECLQERDTLLRIAPELVNVRQFLIPIYRGSRRSPWQIYVGLKLYDVLAGSTPTPRSRRLARIQWSGLPPLKLDGLQAVFGYSDAQTDDALLTRAVMKSAESLGAQLRESARFLTASLNDEACEVQFEQQGSTHTIVSRTLVNAAGPWAEKVAARVTPRAPQPALQLVQGSHILLSGLGVENCYYLEAPQDGRAVFVTPWKDLTLVGTTETPFTGDDPASVAATPKEIAYLETVAAHYFPGAQISLHSAFAGLRVLPANRGAIFSRSRELLIVHNAGLQPRAVHMYGGKLTSYRSDALRVLKQLRSVLPGHKAVADTRQLVLYPP